MKRPAVLLVIVVLLLTAIPSVFLLNTSAEEGRLSNELTQFDTGLAEKDVILHTIHAALIVSAGDRARHAKQGDARNALFQHSIFSCYSI